MSSQISYVIEDDDYGTQLLIFCKFNFQLNFRVKQKNFHTTMAVVKGSEWEASRVKEVFFPIIFMVEIFGNFSSFLGYSNSH